MSSKYERPIYPTVINIPFEGLYRRTDFTGLYKIITQKSKDIEKKITILEQNIQWQEEEINKEIMELETMHLTREDTPEKAELKIEIEDKKKRILALEDNKQMVENEIEDLCKELDTIEETLWINKIWMTPPTFRPYRMKKRIWNPSNDSIQTEICKRKMEEDTRKENITVIRTSSEKRPSRLRSFFSFFRKN
ncbi:uncharacterized protein LOC143770014 [Ranitomeya variabilis]|uniref:uncharacterized protein LOC143770014 n=1 Tax=Ranitomeya variabilis TaxID=490064 RepID=UPI00405621FF